MQTTAPPPARIEKSAPQKAMDKLGLRRDIDLALHLPLRYEDETRIVAIAELRHGDHAQVEGVVTGSEIQLRSRRQLVVRLDDGREATASGKGTKRSIEQAAAAAMIEQIEGTT